MDGRARQGLHHGQGKRGILGQGALQGRKRHQHHLARLLRLDDAEVGAAVQRARRGKRRDRAGAVEQDRAALGVHERAGEKPPHEDVRA